MTTCDVTPLLCESSRHDAQTVNRLFEALYEDLNRVAAALMARERANHTLQPTALVHEVYERLVDQARVDWQGRTHFLAVAANAMHRVLIDHARGRNRDKRGGQWQRVTLSGAGQLAGRAQIDMLALLDALESLEARDAQQAQVVRLRYFVGLTTAETAETLGVSVRTVERDWTHAKAWLKRELSQGDD